MPVTYREVEEADEAVRVALEREEVRGRLPRAGTDPDLLVRAGTRVLDMLEAIRDDAGLWKRAREVDRLPERLSPEQLARIRDVLASDLGILLAGLGYRPPPPLLEFRRDVHVALTRVLDPQSRSTGLPPGADEAERALAYLTFRLRYLLGRADGAAGAPGGRLQRAVRSGAEVMRRLEPGAARGGVGTAVKFLVPVPVLNEILGGIAGEVAGELLQDLLLRGALPEVVAEVDDLRAGDVRDWEDDVSRALAAVHTRAATAIVAWDAHSRIGPDAALFLAREQLVGAHAHWRVLADLATRPGGWGPPVDIGDIAPHARPSRAPDAVQEVIDALDHADLSGGSPQDALRSLREVAYAAEHALTALQRSARGQGPDAGDGRRGDRDETEGEREERQKHTRWR